MAGEKHTEPFQPRTFGDRVAHARRLLGVYRGRDILPSDLAQLVGVTVNAVYAWEAGTVPSAANLERLARELGVPVPWLHYGEGALPIARFQVPDEVAIALAKAKSDGGEGEPPTEQPADDPPEKPRRAAGDHRAPKRPRDPQ